MVRVAEESVSPRGRTAAGQDPVKRDQILDGARRCFMRLGFEAASMNEITTEAGVSKGTIYVYFANKEELFVQLIERERSSLLDTATSRLLEGESIAAALQGFGVALATRLSSDDVVRAQRIVLGVAERLPQVARSFFGPEPFSGVAILQGYLDSKVAGGALTIPDTDLAARQFIELSTAATFKRRLFGTMTQEMPVAEVERVVESAVAMFMAFYGAGPQGGRSGSD